MIKSITYRFLAAIALLTLAACTEYDDPAPAADEASELSGISATLSRSDETVAVADLKDYVGRKEFAHQDRAVFVTIKRTERPIPLFWYKDIEFVCSVTEDGDVRSTGWSRDKQKGTTEAGTTETAPDRIYWSDATHNHTFTGYCAPQQGETEKAFDWYKSATGEYYGSLGDPELTGGDNDTIDFRSTYNEDGTELVSGNVVLSKNDILLTNSTQIKASDAIANLKFYHGLAQVRVIVNISAFAASGKDDTKSVVSDMILKDMLTMYKWNPLTPENVATTQLAESDQAVIGAFEGYTTKPQYNQRKSVKLWIPEPKGVGENASKTFTFYGLVVPTQITDEDKPLEFSFKVTYPNPMKPTEMMEHPYTASIDQIHFDAGKCTTISISLNHQNEKITIGAEYDDWDFTDTPDQGSLKKNSTFLQSTERNKITILGDEKATIDDAKWLYVDATDNKIKDVYGNDGSAQHPFQISTADQLLSFAYEVKGTNRTSVSYTGLDGATHPLAGGFDFTGYYVALDAGITLQATEKKTQTELELQNPNIDKTSSEYTNAPSTILNWIGIGEVGKRFNGNFLGGVRLISRLNGNPFFMELGPQAHVGQLILENVIDINGEGGLAEINRGVICACKVDGNVTSEATDKPVGSIVGTNDGLVFACYHVGDLTARSAAVVGGLIGRNSGTGSVVASYNYGKITGKSGGVTYGILGQFDRIANAGEYNSVFGCYYDNTKANNVAAVAPPTALSATYPSSGITTVNLMKSTFAVTMNNTIQTWVDANQTALTTLGQDPEHFKAHKYVSQPASYPVVY